jgi:glycosyltransferase involved in cell wall biosynthesis
MEVSDTSITNIQQPGFISVVMPAYNEADGIQVALQELSNVLNTCAESWEIIVVDDGSNDGTFLYVSEAAKTDARVKGIRLSRNFGKEAAILAGLKVTLGDAVITIDADLQHPPRLIPEFLNSWRKGAKIVHGIKHRRDEDTWISRLRAHGFNSLMAYLCGLDIRNSSDFKLLDRVVVDAITNNFPERKRFYRGLVHWVGYQQSFISFDVQSRNLGVGKWSLRELISLATTGIVSFSATPLRIVTILGLMTLLLGFAIGVDAVWSWSQGKAVSGFATIIITLLILGSFIMISLGVIGEYIAKIYEEIKERPVYLVEEQIGINSDGTEL